MSITVAAVYEDGVLKPDQPLELADKTRVQVTIETPAAVTEADTWEAADRFVGFIKDAPPGEPIAQDHDKYLYK